MPGKCDQVGGKHHDGRGVVFCSDLREHLHVSLLKSQRVLQDDLGGLRKFDRRLLFCGRFDQPNTLFSKCFCFLRHCPLHGQWSLYIHNLDTFNLNTPGICDDIDNLR